MVRMISFAPGFACFSLDAVPTGHGNVQKLEVWLVCFRCFENLPAIGGRRDHREFRRHQGLQSFNKDGMVVGK